MDVVVYSICNDESSVVICFFFQAEDGIRDLVRSRGLGDVYKRQVWTCRWSCRQRRRPCVRPSCRPPLPGSRTASTMSCLLYTSDAADERSSVDLGGRRIIKKKKSATVASVRMLSTCKRTDATSRTIRQKDY